MIEEINPNAYITTDMANPTSLEEVIFIIFV